MTQQPLPYLSFARKYRPSNFRELMGQEVLVKTLSHSITQGRLAQALLLTGIRGVGKTSSARIIAKTVNCTSLKTDQEDLIPCNECHNCQAFNNQAHPDIIEIDAASRTGVDDIREVIEGCEYRPLLGQYKLYIIDEVHMLSKSAFNALLKIVEEPPKSIIFLFATTEVHKIPTTILSRCQRYDLRRLSFDEIRDLLQNITKQEELKFENAALEIIASRSEGSARDATVMLDQAVNYAHHRSSDQVISADEVVSMLGLVQIGLIVRMVRFIIEANAKEAIDLLEEIYTKASSLQHFVEAVGDFIADLNRAKVINEYRNPLHKDYADQITEILLSVNLARLSLLWQVFAGGVAELKISHNELITTQMLIIKAIYACKLPSVEELIDLSNSLEATTKDNKVRVEVIDSVVPVLNQLALEEQADLPKKKA